MPTVQYQKNERPRATSACPQMGTLMSARDRKDWVKVKFPKSTPYFDTEGRPIHHQNITLNAHTFIPGQEYELPPIVADELKKSIHNYLEGIAFQMQKRNRANIPAYASQQESGAIQVVGDFDSMFEDGFESLEQVT